MTRASADPDPSSPGPSSPGPSSGDAALVTAAAANVAAWHQSSLDALGVGAEAADGWWVADLLSPSIWFTAVSLDPDASPDAELVRERLTDAERAHCLCDTWDRLPLTAVGLSRERSGSWFAATAADREGADSSGDGPQDGRDECSTDGLVIELVEEPLALEQFERVAAVAFGAPFLPSPFEIHAPGVLNDPNMHVWLARLDGEPVGTAMAYDAAGVRGVYGVGTVPAVRRRGVATALTRTALAGAGDRPATLQPSADAAPLYRALGFREVGTWSLWT